MSWGSFNTCRVRNFYGLSKKPQIKHSSFFTKWSFSFLHSTLFDMLSTKICKNAPIRFFLPVCSSVLEQIATWEQTNYFLRNLLLGSISKNVDIFRFWLQSDNNNWLAIENYKHFCSHLERDSLNVYWSEKFLGKICRKREIRIVCVIPFLKVLAVKNIETKICVQKLILWQTHERAGA